MNINFATVQWSIGTHPNRRDRKYDEYMYTLWDLSRDHDNKMVFESAFVYSSRLEAERAAKEKIKELTLNAIYC